MSLDDAINAARQQAQMWDERERRRREREQRERDEVRALGVETAARLRDIGSEAFVRAEKAKWYQFIDTYSDSAGVRYAIKSGQRCWVLSQMSGRRGGDSNAPWLASPVLLLADGTIGRFWPIPQLHPARSDEYVSTIDLDPIEEEGLFLGAGAGSYVDTVKRHLAEAVVRYERRAH